MGEIIQYLTYSIRFAFASVRFLNRLNTGYKLTRVLLPNPKKVFWGIVHFFQNIMQLDKYEQRLQEKTANKELNEVFDDAMEQLVSVEQKNSDSLQRWEYELYPLHNHFKQLRIRALNNGDLQRYYRKYEKRLLKRLDHLTDLQFERELGGRYLELQTLHKKRALYNEFRDLVGSQSIDDISLEDLNTIYRLVDGYLNLIDISFDTSFSQEHSEIVEERLNVFKEAIEEEDTAQARTALRNLVEAISEAKKEQGDAVLEKVDSINAIKQLLDVEEEPEVTKEDLLDIFKMSDREHAFAQKMAGEDEKNQTLKNEVISAYEVIESIIRKVNVILNAKGGLEQKLKAVFQSILSIVLEEGGGQEGVNANQLWENAIENNIAVKIENDIFNRAVDKTIPTARQLQLRFEQQSKQFDLWQKFHVRFMNCLQEFIDKKNDYGLVETLGSKELRHAGLLVDGVMLHMKGGQLTLKALESGAVKREARIREQQNEYLLAAGENVYTAGELYEHQEAFITSIPNQQDKNGAHFFETLDEKGRLLYGDILSEMENNEKVLRREMAKVRERLVKAEDLYKEYSKMQKTGKENKTQAQRIDEQRGKEGKEKSRELVACHDSSKGVQR